jgi:hypothetical protein
MNILTIPLSNIRRKPTKITLVLVFSLGVMSIVALHQVSLVMGGSLEKKLISYGANIIVSPRTESLSVFRRDFSISPSVALSFGVAEYPASLHGLRQTGFQ